MSEVRLVVREAERDWSGVLHAGCADRAIAALSADPTSLEELETATERFAASNRHSGFYANLRTGLRNEPHDAGLVVLDLLARLVVVDSTYSSPGKEGTVAYHDGRCCTEANLHFDLADDWLFVSDGIHWQDIAARRRQERAARPVIEARSIFYGTPLLEFVARETFAAFARRDEIAAAAHIDSDENSRSDRADEASFSLDPSETDRLADEASPRESRRVQERQRDAINDELSRIHAAWLLTPRDDLAGVSPRELALGGNDHLNRDLHNQRHNWSLLDQCPPGLAKSSHAFRYSAIGIHELVTYYELVRELLWSCWEQLTELAQSTVFGHRPDSMTVGDFLTTEVPRLESVREAWLDTPDVDCHGRTPRSIIDRERARLPEGMSARDAMIDPDCPCCQMMAEIPGPVFWHLDGCDMDEGFAFDLYCRTREEWDEEQLRWAESARRLDAECSDCERDYP